MIRNLRRRKKYGTGPKIVYDHCVSAIEAWDDGNPYFKNQDGEKEYAYHELDTG